MSDTVAMALDLKIRDLRNAAGMTQQQLADLVGISKPHMSEVERGVKNLNNHLIERLSRALRVSPGELLGGRAKGRLVAVAGRVGAGARVDLVDSYAKGGGLYHVTCPPQIRPEGVVAVEVEGDSMAPVYMPGAVLFYSRDAMGVPTEAVGRICVCEDSDGMAWVKQVKVGRDDDAFSLLSINPEAENIHGVKLKWASPVRLALPVELVEKVD